MQLGTIIAALNIPLIESNANVRAQIPTSQPPSQTRPDNMSKGEKVVDTSTSRSAQGKGKNNVQQEDPLITIAKQRPQDQLFVDFLQGLLKTANDHYYR